MPKPRTMRSKPIPSRKEKPARGIKRFALTVKQRYLVLRSRLLERKMEDLRVLASGYRDSARKRLEHEFKSLRFPWKNIPTQPNFKSELGAFIQAELIQCMQACPSQELASGVVRLHETKEILNAEETRVIGNVHYDKNPHDSAIKMRVEWILPARSRSPSKHMETTLAFTPSPKLIGIMARISALMERKNALQRKQLKYIGDDPDIALKIFG